MARISVSVKPGSKRPGIALRDGSLEVRVAAPPRDGEATEAVRRALAAALGVPPRDVALVRGASARQKAFEIAGLTPEQIHARLVAAAEPEGAG
jgi:hypothetical protein